jgi:phosphoglycerol transferase MdoB-like AlkP superfamily enzyme
MPGAGSSDRAVPPGSQWDVRRWIRFWLPLLLLDALLFPTLVARVRERHGLAGAQLLTLLLCVPAFLLLRGRTGSLAQVTREQATRWARDWRGALRRGMPGLLLALVLLCKQLFIVSDLGLASGPYLLPISLMTSLLLGLWVSSTPSATQWPLALLIDIAVSAVLFIDRMHFGFFGGIPNWTRLADMKTLHESSLLKVAVGAIRGSDALLVADFPFLLGAWLTLRRSNPPRRLPGAWAVLGTFILFRGVGLLATADRGHREAMYGDRALFRALGPLAHHSWDAFSYATRELLLRPPSPSEQAELRQALRARADAGPRSGPLHGAAAGLNVIVLQVESLETYPFDLVFHGQEVLPNLDRLASESLHWDDFYSEIGVGMTADASFAVNCSMRAMPAETVYTAYGTRTYRCLPQILREHGYGSFGLGGHDPDFQNTAFFHLRNGFERQYTIRDFVVEDRIGVGMSDASFLRQAAPLLSSLPQPFYAFVTTLSSHVPYDDFAYSDLWVNPALAGTSAEQYLNALHYTDAAIGRFVEALRRSGLLERSLLVVYGDHWDHGIAEYYPELAGPLGLQTGNDAATLLVKRHIPFFIHFPADGPAGSVSGPAGQIDILPTVLDLLGINEPLPLFLGRIAAGERSEAIAFPDGSALDADHVYIPGDGAGEPECFTRVGPSPMALTACASLAEIADRERAFSAQIIQRDLFRGFDPANAGAEPRGKGFAQGH